VEKITRICCFFVLVSLTIINCGKDSKNPVSPGSYNLHGKILENGGGVPDVSVQVTGNNIEKTIITQSDGSYLLTDLVDGTYIITPSKNDYSFNPSNVAVVISGESVDVDDIIALNLSSFQDIPVLSNVRANPFIFSPNNDNINDFTIIEFTLAKIECTIEINIYDTNNKQIKKLFNDVLNPMDYFLVDYAGQEIYAKQLPGYWDGRNDNGEIATPGVYTYTICGYFDEIEYCHSGVVVIE